MLEVAGLSERQGVGLGNSRDGTAISVREMSHGWFWGRNKSHSAGHGQYVRRSQESSGLERAIGTRDRSYNALRGTVLLELQCPQITALQNVKKYDLVNQQFSTCGS